MYCEGGLTYTFISITMDKKNKKHKHSLFMTKNMWNLKTTSIVLVEYLIPKPLALIVSWSYLCCCILEDFPLDVGKG